MSPTYAIPEVRRVSSHPGADGAADLPPVAREAFAVYLTDGRRSLPETAAYLHVDLATLVEMWDTYRLFDRAAQLDADQERAHLAHARALLASNLPGSAQTLIDTAATRLVPDRFGRTMPPPDSPTAQATRAALAIMAIFGLAPVRSAHIQIGPLPSVQPIISDVELAALIDAGDSDTLTALALGRPLPPRTYALPAPGEASPHTPEDFPKTQPGGRVVPGTHPSLRPDSASPPSPGGTPIALGEDSDSAVDSPASEPRPRRWSERLPRLDRAEVGAVGMSLILDGEE